MRLYPDVPRRRIATLARDAIVAALLVLFAWLGLAVHDAVDRLAVLGEGVQATGGAVQGGFDAAAEAVDETPVVGGEIADGLRGAGEETGGEVVDLGERGESSVHRLADVLGLLVFGLPAALLLARFVPSRIAQARALTAADRVLRGAPPREVAMRAAFSLPYGALVPHTRDPLGDLAAERYEGLVAAALDDAGLRPRPTS